MSGPIHTLKNYLVTGSSANDRNLNLFNGVSQFFDTHPGFQRIASNTGSPPDGNNAFRVWRAVSGTNKFDVICKWSWNQFWTDWTINADFGVGLAVGAHSSGEAWNGTTNNPEDLHPNPPFKAGSAVMARQVSAGGDISGSKDYFSTIAGSTTADYQLMQASGDNDSFTFALDEGNNGAVNFIFHFERFIPVNNKYTLPFFLWTSNGTANTWLERTITYGNTSNTSNQDAALLYISNSQGSVTASIPLPESVRVDYYVNYSSPIPLSTSFVPSVLEYPILLVSQETGGAYVGILNALRVTYKDLRSYSRLGPGESRLVLSSTNQTTPTITMHWSGTAPSGSHYSSSIFLTGSDVLGRSGGAGVYIDRLGTTDPIVTVVSQTIVTSNFLYRGRIGANYVFQVGSPPAGATDIVVMGIV